MAPTPSIHESHQAELHLQGSAENPSRGAGITVDDDNDMALEVPKEYPPQTTMINPSGAVLALNDHPFNPGSSQGNPFFGTFPHSGYYPAANYSHLTPNIASPWGAVNSGGVVDAMSQPSLQPSNTVGAFGPNVDATHHQPHDNLNQYPSVIPVSDLQSNSAPFHVQSFEGTPSGLQLPFDMSGTTRSQDLGNFNSNDIGEHWNPPTNLQPDSSFLGAGNELLNSQTNDFGALPMSYEPYAHPVSAHTSGAFHQYPAPLLLQGYAPTENLQVQYSDQSSMQNGSTALLQPLFTAAQDLALHETRDTIMIEDDKPPENVGQMQSFEQVESINSLLPLNPLDTALTGHDGVYDLSGNVYPDMQQPTGFVGQIGDAELSSHSHSVYPVETPKGIYELTTSYKSGYEILPWATGPLSMDMTLRQREPATQPFAPNPQVEPQSSAENPGNTALVVYGPERPPQNSSHQVSKRSRKMQPPASQSKSLATQKKRERCKERQLGRFVSRTHIPEDRIVVFGECTSHTAKKRGKGTQKVARKRGTCTRCHIYHLRCDDGEGECCNNCQKYWATRATQCTLWRWTRDYWKGLAKEFVSFCRSELVPVDYSNMDEINVVYQDSRWLMLVGFVNFLSEQDTFRSVMRYSEGSSYSTPFYFWNYACRISTWIALIPIVNPRITPLLRDILMLFFSLVETFLNAIEHRQNTPGIEYAMLLAYVFRGLEESMISNFDQFGPWLLQALEMRLKVVFSRFAQDGGRGLEKLKPVFLMLNESEVGRALVPKEFHVITWRDHRTKLLKMALPSPHVVCVDSSNHEKACWCGLLLSSIPLDVMRFFGIEDKKGEHDFQWNTFITKYCTWMRSLGKTDPREMFIDGRWKRSVRRIFTIQLQKVLESVLEIIEIWQGGSVLGLTEEELMIDCEHWLHRIFSATLRTTAEHFLATISGSPREDTIRANPSQEDVLRIVKPIFFKILATRKFKALETKNRASDIDDIIKWMEAQITAKQSSGSATT